MMRLFCVWILWFGSWAVMVAQNASNPFELTFRLPKTVLADGTEAEKNPFDVVPHRVPGVAKAMAENATEAFRPFSVLPRGGGMTQPTLFWILMGMFGLLTISIAMNRGAVGKAWRGFLNESALTLAQRESAGIMGSTPYYLLYANFLLQAGLFIFLVTRVFKKEAYNNLGFLLFCLFGAGIMFLSKHFFLRVSDGLFPLGNTAQRYNFLIIIFNCVLGLFLVPFNLLLAFSGKLEGLLVFWTLGLVAIFYLYRALRSSALGSKFLADDQFHFLLYLCTVEIAPVLLLVKLAITQTQE